jgi:hypothetical protein
MKRYEPRPCRTCDKKVEVTFFGTYRRHFATAASGRRHLCPASGRDALTQAEAEAALRRRTV